MLKYWRSIVCAVVSLLSGLGSITLVYLPPADTLVARLRLFPLFLVCGMVWWGAQAINLYQVVRDVDHET